MQYYYLSDINRVGKIENFIPYLYDKDKGWVQDNDNILMDRIMGYDEESIGNTSMLTAEEITEEEAMNLIAQE